MPVLDKPFLRNKVPTSFEEIPEVPCYEAGFLTTKNAGWRNFRPVVDSAKCKNCLQCYMVCPDGTISKEIKIDYDFCKGCGICAKQCKFEAIKMEAEK